MSQGFLHSSQGNSHNSHNSHPPAEVASTRCTDPHARPQPKARQKDAAVKKDGKVSELFEPGEAFLTYKLISNDSLPIDLFLMTHLLT